MIAVLSANRARSNHAIQLQIARYLALRIGEHDLGSGGIHAGSERHGALAAGTVQVPGCPSPVGAVGMQAKTLTLGMANPVASTTIAEKAPGMIVPAWPVSSGPVTVSPGCGVMNWTVGVNDVLVGRWSRKKSRMFVPGGL